MRMSLARASVIRACSVSPANVRCCPCAVSPSRISRQTSDVPNDVTKAHCTFNPSLSFCNDLLAIHGAFTLKTLMANLSNTIRPLSCSGLDDPTMPGWYVAETTQMAKFSVSITTARMMAARTARSLTPRRYHILCTGFVQSSHATMIFVCFDVEQYAADCNAS